MKDLKTYLEGYLFQILLYKMHFDLTIFSLKNQDASMYSRIIILSVRGQLVRKFMLAAHQLGMTKGDWIFLDVEIFQVSQLDSPSNDS